MAILTNHTTNTPVTPTKKRTVDVLQLPSPEASPKKPRLSGLYVDSIYARAKALFQRSTHTKNLVGREMEASTLDRFLDDSMASEKGNSMYIAGPPGTGKSAQIAVSLAHRRSVTINCMIVSNPHHIFHEIYCRVSKELSTSFHRKKTSTDLKELIAAKTYPVVVVLDEMDCLITRSQDILFELFSLTLSTRLVLIGISNSLDFTNKFLPRLKRSGVDPQLLNFLPYSCEQIRAIITDKLGSLEDKYEDKENQEITGRPLFHPAALQLCCKKSASTTGDLRNAFDLCYKAIELVENSLKSQGKDMATFTLSNCPQVLLPHVAKVCSFSQKGNSGLAALNFLQKTMLCYLFRFQITNIGQVPTINSFFDYYSTHNNKLVATVNKGEFLEIVQALEATSCVALTEGKKANDSGNKIVKVSIQYDDLIKAIGDVGPLRDIINGKF